MPINKYRSIMDKVQREPVFGVEDLVKRGVPRGYAKKRLFELSKAGRIKRVERGKYTVLDDVDVVATHLTRPCYLSMWSALSIHGLTTQIPFAVEIVTTRKRYNRNITYNDTRIIFYTAKQEMMFGYENLVWKDNYRIPVAKPEKTVIDALYFGVISVDELKEAVNSIDRRLLTAYAKLTRNDQIITKVRKLMTC